MALRKYRHQPVDARMQHLEAGVAQFAAGQADIHFFVAHQRVDHAGDHVAHMKAHARHGLLHVLHEFRQYARRESGQARDPHRAARSFAERTRVDQHVFHVMQGLLQERQQFAAGRRECDIAAVAIEQAQPDRLLEAAYLHRQGRLREMQARGRARETAGLRHGDKRANVSKVQIHDGL
ncbi:hypothetical protein R69658_02992 [Paraburkholderia aspalathi]|uniref:Uncharacterized protein n=1 Tax=Paraburkholderia aspalathi TaxID=1324617 RepID=A0ABM8RK74_9BURK|nr:hypothetical protein R69658_02992 [Paraburkholderia aspalathi]